MKTDPKSSPRGGLKFRTAVLCLGVALLGVLPSAFFLLHQQKQEGCRHLHDAAEATAAAIAQVAQAPPNLRRSLVEQTAQRLMHTQGGGDHLLIVLPGAAQGWLITAGGQSRMVPAAPSPAGETVVETDSAHSGRRVMLSVKLLPGGGHVEAAVSMDHFYAALASARQQVIAVGITSILTGVLCAWFFARRISRPLGQLCGMARGIAGGDLTRRAPAVRGAHEIATLADDLNTMASQLEAGQRRMLEYQSDLEKTNTLLAQRIRWQQVLASVSAEFLKPEHSATDDTFVTALSRIAAQLDLEGGCIFTRSPGNAGVLCKTWEWACTAGPICKMERIPEAAFPWAISHVSTHRVLSIADTAALPDHARAERINLQRLGITAAAGAALGTGEKPVAYLFLRGHRGPRMWTEDEEHFVTLAAGIFSNALARREAAAERDHLHAQLLQSQKMEAVGQLSGGIAHDFNNMLVPIIGYSDSILTRTPADSPWAGDLREIKRAAESAASITRRLLTFSRQQITTRKELDLNGHIESVHRMLDRLLGENIQLNLDLAPDLWSIYADNSQIDQCLVNLAVNARAAMPATGGVIRVATTMLDSEDKDFQHPPGRKMHGLFIRLDVTDTGCGMDAATLLRIFEPFFSTKGEHGTGLGLSVVHGVVQEHGGWITVDSRVGKGTTFHLWLPALHEPLPKPMDTGMATATVVPRGSGQSILLIEDEPGVLAFVSAALRQHGYKVLTASNGADARKIYRESHSAIDLVMSDVVLPDASGVELVEEFFVINGSLRALLSSGYNDRKQALVDLVENRGVRFLHKPYTLLELLESVHGALHGTGAAVALS